MSINKKEYTHELLDQTLICEDVENELLECQYVGDLFCEQADNCIDIYSANLWKTAADFEEYTEEAVAQGLVDMKDFNFIKLFQMGQYQYYTQMCYNNEKEMYFNVLHSLYMELDDDIQKLVSEEDIEEAIEKIDNNSKGSDFQKAFDSMMESLKED